MLILQLANLDDPSGGLGRALSNIRELAEQVICYADDMEYVADGSDLMKVPANLLPRASTELDLLLHNNEDVVCIAICKQLGLS